MICLLSSYELCGKNREFTRLDHCSPRKSSRICAPWQINKQTTQTGMMIFIQTRWKEWTFWDLSSVSHCIDPKSKCCCFMCQCKRIVFACYSIWKRRIVHVRSDTLGYTCKHLDVHNKKIREHPVFLWSPIWHEISNSILIPILYLFEDVCNM